MDLSNFSLSQVFYLVTHRMIFVLGGTFIFRYIRLAIQINARFYSDAPVPTINAFFLFRKTGSRIGGVIPVPRIVNACMTSFVNPSAIVNINTTSLVNRSVLI